MEEMVVRGEMRGVVVGRSPDQSPGYHSYSVKSAPQFKLPPVPAG